VVLQMAALAGVAILGLIGPGWPAAAIAALRVLGLALVISGAALGVLGARALGPSLTAYPRPSEGAAMRQHGVYAHARHPIYGGVLVIGAGWCLASSWWAAVAWACLLVILLAKSEREEAWLVQRYAGYPSYRATVRRRFVPYVF